MTTTSTPRPATILSCPGARKVVRSSAEMLMETFCGSREEEVEENVEEAENEKVEEEEEERCGNENV